MKSLFRLLTAVCAPLLVAACVAPPQAEPCQSTEACALSVFVADSMRPSIGQDFGGGLTLLNAQAAGSLVVIDLQVPLPGGPLEDVQKRALHTVATEGFVAGFCEDRSRDVFVFGNAFQMRSFGTDSVPLGTSTIRSCGG